MHCHQDQLNTSSSVIFVAKDGVQYPPIIFDNPNHFKLFLTCLENGLEPNYKIDPPEWEKIIEATNFSIVLKINFLFVENNEDMDMMETGFVHDPKDCFELSPIGVGIEQNKTKLSFDSMDFNLFETNISKNR